MTTIYDYPHGALEKASAFYARWVSLPGNSDELPLGSTVAREGHLCSAQLPSLGAQSFRLLCCPATLAASAIGMSDHCTPAKTNQAWVADIAYIGTRSGWL
jgi:hypothetical protein